MTVPDKTDPVFAKARRNARGVVVAYSSRKDLTAPELEEILDMLDLQSA